MAGSPGRAGWAGHVLRHRQGMAKPTRRAMLESAALNNAKLCNVASRQQHLLRTHLADGTGQPAWRAWGRRRQTRLLHGCRIGQDRPALVR